MTVAGGEITDIGILRHSETPGIGDRAMQQLADAVIGGQTVEVDTVSGATVTSAAFLAAVGNALEADPAAEPPPVEAPPGFPDGTHRGTREGYGGELTVEVVVEDGAIAGITVSSHSDTPAIAEAAFGRLIEAVLESQSTEVDVVSGATASSDGLLQAVRAALGE